jgi:hypothetical protein
MSALTFLDLPQRLRLLLLTEPPRAFDYIPLCRSSLALGIPQFKSVNRRTRGGVALHPLLEQVLQRMGPPAYPSSAGPCSGLHVSRVRGTLKEEGDQTVSIKIRLQRPNTTTSRSLVYNHQDHRLMVS